MAVALDVGSEAPAPERRQKHAPPPLVLSLCFEPTKLKLSLKDLIADLGTLCRNTVRVTTIDATYQQLTTPTELQKRAFELLELKLA